MPALNEAAREAGRPINPSIYSREKIRRELMKNNAFINRVLSHPKHWELGKESYLREIRGSVK